MFAYAHQVLGLTGKRPFTVFEPPIIQRPDTDRVACRDQFALYSVPEEQSELRIQSLEHLNPVFMVQRQQDLTVRIACERVFSGQLILQLLKTIDLTITDTSLFIKPERLHALGSEFHDRQSLKADQSIRHFNSNRLIRSSFA